MGYDTRYRLTLCGAAPREAEEIMLEETLPGVDLGRMAGRLADSVTWHEHEEHMVAISRRWPRVLFVLDGQGDDAEDRWRLFVLDGRAERHKAEAWVPPESPTSFAWTPRDPELLAAADLAATRERALARLTAEECRALGLAAT